MKTFISSSFQVGSALQIHNRQCTICGINAIDGSVKVNFSGEIPQVYSAKALLEMYLDETLIFGDPKSKCHELNDISSLTEEQRETISARILANSRVTPPQVTEIIRDNGFSIDSV